MFLHKLNLLKVIADDGHKIVTSDYRLSYYSANIEIPVRDLIKNGIVELIDYSDEEEKGANNFVEKFSLLFYYAGEGILFLMHLCMCKDLVLILEEEEEMVKSIASNFSVKTIPIADFCRQKIKDKEYQDFVISMLAYKN